MKSFKLKTPLTIKILLIVCIAISLLGAGWNIFNLLEYSKIDLVKTVCYFIAVVLSLILVAFCISFFFSKYKLKGETLFCYTGFIKTKLSLVDLSQIQFEEQTERTFLVFNEDKALVIMLYSKDVTEFVNEVIKNNNKVEFRSLPKLK